MKKKIIRILLCLMIASMLLACAVGCKKRNEIKESEESEQTAGSDIAYDENGYLMDELPDELDYGSTEISILGWNSEVTEFEVLEPGNMAIDDSIYRRNVAIEARLNVRLKFDLTVPGHNAAQTRYAQHVERTFLGGSPYDVAAAHSSSIATCAIKGLRIANRDKPWQKPNSFRGVNTADHPRHPSVNLKISAIRACFEEGNDVQ